jgi:SAM-dependent methyltransferase
MTKNKLLKPILVKNKNLRKKFPIIQKYFQLSLKETDNFPKKNNIIVSKKIVRKIGCSVCQSKKSEDFFVYQGFVHSKCLICSHIYISNPLNENILIESYKSSKTDEAYIKRMKTKFILNYNNKLYEKYYKISKKYINKNSTLLEVGCGTGQFLKFLVKKGHNPYASEFIKSSKHLVAKIIDKDRFFFQVKNSDLPFKNYFDFIYLWGVFEHLRFPLNELKIFNKLLKKGGKIFFLIPNLQSRAFELLGMATPTITPKNHLNFFTDKSFNYICKKTGFKVLKKYQELPIIDLMYDYINNEKKEIKKILKEDKSYYRAYFIQKQ